MELFELILLLISGVLAAALLSSFTSRISAPLIEIIIGVVFALIFGSTINIDLDPELFLLIFIAPLLFNEAQKINRLEFWKNKVMILSLALGLVIVTTLAVGYTLNLIVPTIGLAVAFALGATLGPTDAVAVSSLSNVAALSKRQKVILAGESLINDASGLVAFQFACAAAVTGSFSIIDGGEEFLLLFLGGIAFGLVCGFILNFFVYLIRSNGFDNEIFHVLLGVAVPFAIFLFAEELGVSGVLAVVACGIVFSISYGQAGYSASKANVLSNSVWELISFALNGIVFVLLGIMLPGGMISELGEGLTTINYELIGIALLITFVVIGVRFIWCVIINRVIEKMKNTKENIKHSLILSCSGAKGAITLSLILTLPSAIAVRNELIFVASIVILTTLLIANFLVPVLAPRPKEEANERKVKEAKCYIKSLRRVVERLTNELEDAETYYEKAAYQTVIQEYVDRIELVQTENEDSLKPDNDKKIDLSLETIEWQRQKLKKLRTDDRYTDEMLHQVAENLDTQEDRIEKRNKVVWTFTRAARKTKVATKAILKSMGIWKVFKKKNNSAEYAQQLSKLTHECQQHALDMLIIEQSKNDSKWTPEVIGDVITEYQKNLLASQTQPISVTKMIYSNEVANDIRLKSLGYEHDLINEFYKKGEIDRRSVNVLRRKISTIQMDIIGEI